MQPATLSPEDAIERLVTVQLEYNLKLFSLSTKARLIRQFGYKVEGYDYPTYDSRIDWETGCYTRTVSRWDFLRAGNVSCNSIDFDGECFEGGYETEAEAVDAAIEDIRESYPDSQIMAVLCEPRKSAKEVLGGMQ